MLRIRTSAAGCLIAGLPILIISAVIGGLAWPYAINTCLGFAGKSPAVGFWAGALIGFCPGLGQFGLPVAVIVWIVSLFML